MTKNRNKGLTTFMFILLSTAVSSCCNCGEHNGDKPAQSPNKEKSVGGDNVNIENNGCGTVIYNKNGRVCYMDGNGNLYNENGELIYTSGNGNNTSSRNSGTENWNRGTKHYQKKVVKEEEKEKVEEEKVEEKKPEEPKTYTGTLVIDVYHQNCNSY